MDELYPGWLDEMSELTALRAQLTALESQLSTLREEKEAAEKERDALRKALESARKEVVNLQKHRCTCPGDYYDGDHHYKYCPAANEVQTAAARLLIPLNRIASELGWKADAALAATNESTETGHEVAGEDANRERFL